VVSPCANGCSIVKSSNISSSLICQSASKSSPSSSTMKMMSIVSSRDGTNATHQQHCSTLVRLCPSRALNLPQHTGMISTDDDELNLDKTSTMNGILDWLGCYGWLLAACAPRDEERDNRGIHTVEENGEHCQ
jgi:hypothetical protein